MNRSNLVIDVENILIDPEPPITDDCCIYKVPYVLREVNEDAYTPKIISIGPLHHYDQRLQIMEKYKRIYFKKFVTEANTKLEDLISCVKDDEAKLRCYYSEQMEISKDELVKVILVDACFIIMLFIKRYYEIWTDDDHHNFLKPISIYNITSDFLLLENQVPFFILEKLYNLAGASHQHHPTPPSFLELSVHFFDNLNRQEFEPNFVISHFTDLLRIFHLQQLEPDRGSLSYKHIPTATALNEAGMKFKRNSKKCMIDLEFSGGYLKIPFIKVEDKTERLLRNMVALEQCHYPHDAYITDYISLMDKLINTEKDVDLLVENGILVNFLGDSAAVAKLFNSLGENIVISNYSSQYIVLFEQLDSFYNSNCQKMRATLKRDYCNTPWHTLATFAAIAILILTLVQAVSSVWQIVQGLKR